MTKQKLFARISTITSDAEILDCMAEIDKLPLPDRTEPMKELRKATLRIQIAKLAAAGQLMSS